MIISPFLRENFFIRKNVRTFLLMCCPPCTDLNSFLLPNDLFLGN